MNKSGKSIQNWEESTWRIDVKLDMPTMEIPVIQWAIFAEDPLARFREDSKDLHKVLQKRGDEIEEVFKAKVAWDRMFKLVTGDQVGVFAHSPNNDQVVSTVMSSNEPNGKKWIATKVNLVDGKPFCWSIPFEAEIKTHHEIVLTEENSIDLVKLFNDAIA